MYRLFIETLLGVVREGDRLRLVPRLPAAWPACTIHYRFRDTVYHITVTRVEVLPPPPLRLDGVALAERWIDLSDDHQEHQVEVPYAEAAG
jgi:cyclic beta-1,2-glucan synthetase